MVLREPSATHETHEVLGDAAGKLKVTFRETFVAYFDLQRVRCSMSIQRRLPRRWVRPSVDGFTWVV